MYHATVWTFLTIPETTLLSTLNLGQSLLSRSRDTVSNVSLTLQNSQPVSGSKIVMQRCSKKSRVFFFLYFFFRNVPTEPPCSKCPFYVQLTQQVCSHRSPLFCVSHTRNQGGWGGGGARGTFVPPHRPQRSTFWYSISKLRSAVG